MCTASHRYTNKKHCPRRCRISTPHHTHCKRTLPTHTANTRYKQFVLTWMRQQAMTHNTKAQTRPTTNNCCRVNQDLIEEPPQETMSQKAELETRGEETLDVVQGPKRGPTNGIHQATDNQCANTPEDQTSGQGEKQKRKAALHYIGHDVCKEPQVSFCHFGRNSSEASICHPGRVSNTSAKSKRAAGPIQTK